MSRGFPCPLAIYASTPRQDTLVPKTSEFVVGEGNEYSTLQTPWETACIFSHSKPPKSPESQCHPVRSSVLMRSITIYCHSVWGGVQHHPHHTQPTHLMPCVQTRGVDSRSVHVAWSKIHARPLHSTIQQKRVLTLLVTLAKSYKYVEHEFGTALNRIVRLKKYCRDVIFISEYWS